MVQGEAANTAPALNVVTPTDDPGECKYVLEFTYRGTFIEVLQLSAADWRYQLDGCEITCLACSLRCHVRQITLKTADFW